MPVIIDCELMVYLISEHCENNLDIISYVTYSLQVSDKDASSPFQMESRLYTSSMTYSRLHINHTDDASASLYHPPQSIFNDTY